MKEGSSADEPINIALSDYSSDEGSSSSSENEGKSSSIKGFSDLEGPCCHPLRAPPCSPEIDAEVRKFRYSRMRKIMQELDRIYFQPLFHKKCQFLFKSERNTIRSRKRKSQKKSEDVTKAKSIKTNSTPYIEANLIQNHNPNSGVLFNNNTSQDISKPPISLSYVLHESESEASIVSVTQENPQECKNVLKRRRGEGGQNPADQKPHKPRLKLSRKLRVWLEKRQILITRRKLSNKMKFRYKSLHKRKKDERFLLDLPTTDPGSELVFSTDDEFVIDGKNNQCYGTMARYIRRGLLQSELQRHYIEEIGDGFRHMPPELIVTSPANKIKRPPIQMQIKPTVKKAITPKSAELPVIDESVKRTSSWQNLGTPSPSASLTSQYPSGNTTKMNSPTPSAINIPNTHTTLALTINMPRTHSPMPKSIFKTKTIAKKEPLSKEDLDIKLSLKKKIWTGIQPDDSPYAVDRTRSLLLAPPASLQTPPTSLKANKTVADGKKGNAKRLENEALLSACTQKLIEWQGTQPNESDQNNSSPAIPQTKLTADFVIPEINQERTMRILKHLVHIKKPGKLRTNHEGKSKQKKSAVTKLTETSTMITKVAKSKAQKTSHRPSNKSHNTNNAVGSLHKLHGRSVNKFKTGGIVATAVQTSTTVKQKSKKHKTTAQKLQDSLGPLKINGTTGGGGGDSRLSTACAIAVRDAPTTIARKVKTKLKKKKSPAKLQNMSSNLNSNTPATV